MTAPFPGLMSTQDTTSLITPALGFDSEAAARKHLELCQTTKTPSAELIQPKMGRDRHYVTIPGQWKNSTSTNLLQHGIASMRSADRLAWHHICEKAERERAKAYLVSILSSGRRQYNRRHRTTDERELQLPDSFNNGLRDCYAVWCKRNTSPLDPIAIINQDEHGNFAPSKRLYSTKAAHGAIYAATEVYGPEGAVIGVEMRLLLITARIMDRDPQRPDKLRLQIVAHTHVRPRRVKTNPMPDLSRIPRDGGWIQLVNQAYEGFLYECSTKPGLSL